LVILTLQVLLLSALCDLVTVVQALDLRLEIAGSIPAAGLSSATLDKLFTHISFCCHAV